MKVLVVMNNLKWESLPLKLIEIKKWFAPAIQLEFEVKYTTFNDIPFRVYIPDTGATGIAYDWYDKNVTPLAGYHDIIMFVVHPSQWLSTKARGWRTDRDNGPVELSMSCSEYQMEKWLNFPYMLSFFQIFRHEICHALYMMKGGVDNTHKYWDMGKLELCLPEFNEIEIQKNNWLHWLEIIKQKVLAIAKILSTWQS